MMLVVGESIVDVVQRPDGSVTEHAGGSPANVAVGLARLGLETTLASTIGQDDHGALIRMQLADAGVRLMEGLAVPERTATSTAILDDEGTPSYTFDLTWAPGPISADLAPDAVHVGSIAAFLQPGSDDVEDLLRRVAPTSVVTFDPNIRPAMLPAREQVLAHLRQIVPLTDIVQASLDDLEWLAPGVDPGVVARRWLDSGPAAVIVTMGPRGSRIHTRWGSIMVPATPARVVDTVGAGDAHLAGLLSALDDEAALGPDGATELRMVDLSFWRRVGTVAARAAAIAVARPGAQPPWRDELYDEALSDE